MAIKNLSDVHITAGLQDKDGQLGTSGQILASTGSQVDWIDQGDIVVGETEKAKSVTIRVKNSTATAMSKGQVICEAVSANPPNGNLIEVALADNNGTNTMPALGVLNEDLDAAGGANDEGDAIMFGKVSGINTSAFSVGDEVFVDDTPGGLTITKPTGTKYIQKVGVVIRDHSSNGTIEVFGAGRVNDVPTPLYVDHANQRLGIGTTSPETKLDVYGTSNTYLTVRNSGGGNKAGIRMYGGSAGISHIWHDDTETNPPGIHFGTSADIATTPTTQLYIKGSNGNVGIGTTSPGHNLVVGDGTQNTESRFYFGDGSYTSASGYGLYMSRTFSYIRPVTDESQTLNIGALNSAWGTISNNALLHTFGKDSTEFMRINSSGNVGIGTASPQAKLHIGPDSLVSGYTPDRSTLAISDITNGGQLVIRGQSPRIWLDGTAGGNGEIYLDNTNLTFQSGNPTSQGGSTMYLKSDGNVGIGTTSPESKLHVSTTTNVITPLLTLHNNTSTNGSVAGASIDFVASSVTSAIGARIISTRVAAGAHMDLRFHTQRDQFAMIIDTSRNVGIGTTSPGSLLHVEGSRTTAAFQANQTGTGVIANFKQGGSSKVLIDNSGNVGIGTTSLSSKLQVAGSTQSTDFKVGSSGTMQIFDYSGNLHIYSTAGTDILLGGGIGGRQNDVTIGNGDLRVSGSVKMGNDTNTASASKAGTLRYRTSGNNSYVDMCMRTGATTYAWVNIVQNNW
jgi:hypothetical protein